MNIELFSVPYDSGQRGRRMGAGPEYFLQQGTAEQLHALGHDVQVHRIESSEAFPAEIAVTFDLNRLLAERVSHAVETRRFPLILAGNCNCCLGALAGLHAAEPCGVLWFDAHADFNTPETTPSGFLDGMGLSMLAGHCWQPLAATIPGFRPLPEEQVVLIGGRDFDEREQERLAQSNLAVVAPEAVRQQGVQAALGPALKALGTRVRSVHLHIDMDVLDPEEGWANGYAVSGGLRVNEVLEGIQLASQQFRIVAAALTSYDPACDADERVLKAGMTFMKSLLMLVERGGTVR